jgi:hypothetical protein
MDQVDDRPRLFGTQAMVTNSLLAFLEKNHLLAPGVVASEVFFQFAAHVKREGLESGAQ